MKTILVPLHAHEIALDATGPDLAEFSFDEARSQVAAILLAFGDRAGELLPKKTNRIPRHHFNGDEPID